MKFKPSIEWVVKNNLCLGCGVCEDACPVHAISFTEKHAVNVPQVDINLCLNSKSGCSRCFDVCPGHGIDLIIKSQNYYGAANNYDDYIGPYISCYTGWSNNYDIRYHSASGGILSHFLIYLLEEHIIDGAVVTKFSDVNPLRTTSFIATNRNEILSAKSSKYCPVSLNGIIRKIKAFSGKVVIVGLPCHIQGMRKTATLDKKFREKVAGYFAIYCSSSRNFKAIKFLLKVHNVDPHDVKEFAFRDDGCLGSMKIHTSQKTVTEPYIMYYSKLRSYFKPRRCSFCLDHYGMLADISFGDIHLAPYFNEIGVNSVIVRNPKFEQYLQQAEKSGDITLKCINCKEVNKSQQMMYKNRDISVPFFLKFEKLLGRKVPQYDLNLPNKFWLKGFRYWMSFTVQRLIGKWVY